MKRSLLLALMPVSLAAAVALPVAAPNARFADAEVADVATSSIVAEAPHGLPAGLRRALADDLHDAVPGAAANGVQVLALRHAPIGIGGWHRVSGSARVGTGATAATLRFSGRFDAGAERMEALRLRWDAPTPAPVDGPARVAIERAARDALAAEFPEQAPAFELLALVRQPALDAAASHRVFHGRGRIDFGAEGAVLAPVEVVLDDEARVVALRYSLDELDPAPFERGDLPGVDVLAVR
jgi:hypothetical protein